MIVAAGLGTRLRPLSELRPKPALPVRGIPLIAYHLQLLAHCGVTETVINVHHLPEVLQAEAERYRPPGMVLRFSVERELLDTGGGIRRVAAFLRESDPSLILGGDMLLDADLAALIARHQARRDSVTMLLRDDPRTRTFGSIGVAGDGSVRRIGGRFDLGGEQAAGIYTWANVVAARAFERLPSATCSATWIIGLRRCSRMERATFAASCSRPMSVSGNRSAPPRNIWPRTWILPSSATSTRIDALVRTGPASNPTS